MQKQANIYQVNNAGKLGNENKSAKAEERVLENNIERNSTLGCCGNTSMPKYLGNWQSTVSSWSMLVS